MSLGSFCYGEGSLAPLVAADMVCRQHIIEVDDTERQVVSCRSVVAAWFVASGYGIFEICKCLVDVAIGGLVNSGEHEVVTVGGIQVKRHFVLHKILQQVTHAQQFAERLFGLGGVKAIAAYQCAQICHVNPLLAFYGISKRNLHKVMEIGGTEYHQQGHETIVEYGGYKVTESLADVVVADFLDAYILKSGTDKLPQHLLYVGGLHATCLFQHLYSELWLLLIEIKHQRYEL